MTVHDGFFRRPAHDESVYMVWSTFHWKRLVNGYAGVEPESYRRMRDLLRRFPSEESITALERAGVRYAIVHRAGYGPNQWARLSRDLPGFSDRLREAARFEGEGDTVYAPAPRGRLAGCWPPRSATWSWRSSGPGRWHSIRRAAPRTSATRCTWRG